MILTVDGLTGEARKVADLFAKYPETRDNYAALVVKYWMIYEWDDLGNGRLTKLTSPELITRVSRKLQNDKEMFQPTQDTQRKRDASITDFQGMEVVK